jgi:hypothetical protein
VRTALATPYADVRAEDLVLELDAPDVPALERLVLDLGAFQVELRLLGHSHQAIVTRAGFALSETVSCRPEQVADGGHLPAARALRRDGCAYAFSADVLPLADFDGPALVGAVEADPHGIVGDFPGTPGAFTALRAAPVQTPGATGVRWETWHAYPQTGELVRTTGEVLDA